MRTQETQRHGTERKFAEVGRSIDDLLQESRATHTARDVRDEMLRELRRIDNQLSPTWAQVGKDLAFTRDDIVEALQKELGVWKGRVEELDVQATLGRMELRDRLAPILRRVEAKLSRIGRDVEAMAEAQVVDEEDLGYSIMKSVTSLRRDIA